MKTIIKIKGPVIINDKKYLIITLIENTLGVTVCTNI